MTALCDTDETFRMFKCPLYRTRNIRRMSITQSPFTIPPKCHTRWPWNTAKIASNVIFTPESSTFIMGTGPKTYRELYVHFRKIFREMIQYKYIMGSVQNWCKYVALAIVCCINNKLISILHWVRLKTSLKEELTASMRFNHKETVTKVENSLDQIHICKQVHVL